MKHAKNPNMKRKTENESRKWKNETNLTENFLFLLKTPKSSNFFSNPEGEINNPTFLFVSKLTLANYKSKYLSKMINLVRKLCDKVQLKSKETNFNIQVKNLHANYANQENCIIFKIIFTISD